MRASAELSASGEGRGQRTGAPCRRHDGGDPGTGSRVPPRTDLVGLDYSTPTPRLMGLPSMFPTMPRMIPEPSVPRRLSYQAAVASGS